LPDNVIELYKLWGGMARCMDIMIVLASMHNQSVSVDSLLRLNHKLKNITKGIECYLTHDGYQLKVVPEDPDRSGPLFDILDPQYFIGVVISGKVHLIRQPKILVHLASVHMVARGERCQVVQLLSISVNTEHIWVMGSYWDNEMWELNSRGIVLWTTRENAKIEAHRAEDERKARNRERNGQKIDEARQVLVRKQFDITAINGLSGFFARTFVSYFHELRCVLYFFCPVNDVSSIILFYYRALKEASESNELRSSAEAVYQGWTKTTRQDINSFSLEKILQSDALDRAGEKSIGYPILFVTLTKNGFVESGGCMKKSVARYCLIDMPDRGLKCRITCNIPSAFFKVQEVGYVEKVVGHDPEPVLGRSYPHGLDCSQWTVFRVVPDSVRTKHLCWVTIYSVDGPIACRPLAYCVSPHRTLTTMYGNSDIATYSNGGFVIMGRTFSWQDILSKTSKF